MQTGTLNRASRCMSRKVKGQAMTEFLMMGFVALIILFVAIQVAAIGREYMALGELNYQVARWATNSENNSITGSNSPQCTDVATLITGGSPLPFKNPPVTAPLATGYMGKIGWGSGHTVCGAPPPGGIGVAMACTAAPTPPNSPTGPPYNAAQCAVLRTAGTGVQITLTMDTSSILFLNLGGAGNPNFLGVPFPATLSVTHTMLTQ